MMQEPPSFHRQILNAIDSAKRRIRWRAGKDVQHLAKRIRVGHLAPSTTLAEYHGVIRAVLDCPRAELYVYRFGQDTYPTVVAEHAGRRWLVMLDLDGKMETAFPPNDPEDYLAQPRFERLGAPQDLEP